MIRRTLLAVLLGGLLSCTLSQLTPTARLSESVNQLNDMSRWNQIDMAVQTVSPKYKAQFRSRRSNWGESVNIAEIELMFQQISSDKKTGVSEVALSWTDASGVFVRKSVVTQQWASEKGSFRLVDETIKKGDPNLFAATAPDAASGNEAMTAAPPTQ